MTIDEAIEQEREKAKEQRYYANFEKNGLMYQSCVKCAEYHEQLAEWLEELKAYRECNVCEYNKAIDDFVRFANTMPTVETEDGEIRPMWLEEMAEQLKAGGDNGA